MEFIDMVYELNSQPTYLDKVKFVYCKFRNIKGKESRVINEKEYVFTIQPTTNEENLIRWEYYIDEESKIKSQEWLEPQIKNLDKSPDKSKAINFILEEISEIISSQSDIKRGYKYGTKKNELNWIKDSALDLNFSHIISPFITGLSFYYSEQKINALKEEPLLEQEDILPNLNILNYNQKLALAYELGIIQFLVNNFEIESSRVRLARVLGIMFGIELNSKTFTNFYDSVRKLYAEDPSKGPLNEKNLDAVRGQLSLIGIKQRLKDSEKK